MYAQGDAYARMYDRLNPSKLFKSPKNLPALPRKKQSGKLSKMDQLGCGNIRASELWDKILSLEATKIMKKWPMPVSKCCPF